MRAISRVSVRHPKKALKVHIEVAGRPVCGGRKGAKSVTGWQGEFGGVDAVNCLACLRILTDRLQKRPRPDKR